ncbi:hypothetical protein ABFS82_10G164500 [Erythranthe guttata]|uniref:RING-type E3 ubiquitin transferase n=1 Tax=Erythranthe guttata TaxID=4155 RepID=A0A022PWW5_ERYGU|nr:PREDICTED: RING-H2 finger protein ATL79-like [Erythranthe guttata]EYU18740.1 hypothetical protein MIMGU_mgv1a024730mg [Erythranthe guttata]|eukprot:XP_012828042.1 PREDICTED: RING-H2 finger protein ATL79-like [Erythranthe guttata]
MRKIPSLRAGVAVATAEFNIHLSPPASAAAPPPLAAADCNAQKCPWWPYTSAKDFKANTAIIVAVLFCALICALALNAAVRYLIRDCSRRRRRNRKEEHGGAAAEEAAEIPGVIYSEETKLSGAETECIICLSEFAAGERIRVLEKCSHGFHLQCIQKWLVSHSSCPTCRTICSNESTTASPP